MCASNIVSTGLRRPIGYQKAHEEVNRKYFYLPLAGLLTIPLALCAAELGPTVEDNIGNNFLWLGLKKLDATSHYLGISLFYLQRIALWSKVRYQARLDFLELGLHRGIAWCSCSSLNVLVVRSQVQQLHGTKPHLHSCYAQGSYQHRGQEGSLKCFGKFGLTKAFIPTEHYFSCYNYLYPFCKYSCLITNFWESVITVFYNTLRGMLVSYFSSIHTSGIHRIKKFPPSCSYVN